jgi:hypothetical protein
VKKVLIATPSYDGKIDVWYVNSLTNTIMAGAREDILFSPVFMSYDALIQRSRNDLLALAVENEFDYILWIDSDMEWDPQWAVDAVKAEHDVFGLPVIKKSLNETYNVKCNPEDLVVGEDGLIKVESIGTGWLLMSRKAFTHLWDNSQAYVHNGQDRRWAFEVKIQDGDIISEDVLVCQKLREGGFDILIDPTKTCNHIGNLKYIGNFARFIEKLAE